MSSVLSLSSPHFSADCSEVIALLRQHHIVGDVTPNRTLLDRGEEEVGCRIVLSNMTEDHARRVGARARAPRRALRPPGPAAAGPHGVCLRCAGSHAVPRGRRAGRALRHHPWRGRDVQESWGPAASRSTHTRVSAAIGMFSFISLISCLYFARWLIHFAYFLLVCCQYVADSLASFLQFSI